MMEDKTIFLENLGIKIRECNKKIKGIIRERETRPTSAMRPKTSSTVASSVPSNDVLKDEQEEDQEAIDPLLDLEDERHKLGLQFEQLNSGVSYVPSPEVQAYDFLEFYYKELSRSQRDITWLLKYYDPDAVLNIIGLTTIEKRENIIPIIMRKYNELKFNFEIIDVQSLPSPHSHEIVLSAQLNVKLYLGDDRPRKVFHILEWVKSKENFIFDITVKREYFMVKDSRPLYHWAELEIPKTRLEIETERIIEEYKKKQKMEELLALQKEAEEREKARKASKKEGEESEEEDDEDSEEYDENEDEEGVEENDNNENEDNIDNLDQNNNEIPPEIENIQEQEVNETP